MIKKYYKWVNKELKRTSSSDTIIDLFNFATGMAEESAEMMERIEELPNDHLILSTDKHFLEEAGDYLWYFTAYCIVRGIEYKEFKTKLHLYLSNSKPNFFQIEKLVCKQCKTLGLFKKKLFLGKEINEDNIDAIMDTCHGLFFSMVVYLKIDIRNLADNNMKKLSSRYPKGRTTSYNIKLIEKNG